jgi:hypothetical protein
MEIVEGVFGSAADRFTAESNPLKEISLISGRGEAENRKRFGGHNPRNGVVEEIRRFQ